MALAIEKLGATICFIFPGYEYVKHWTNSAFSI